MPTVQEQLEQLKQKATPLYVGSIEGVWGSYQRRKGMSTHPLSDEQEQTILSSMPNAGYFDVMNAINKAQQEYEMTGQFGADWRAQAQAQMTPQQRAEVAAGTPTRVSPVTGMPEGTPTTTLGTKAGEPTLESIGAGVAGVAERVAALKERIATEGITGAGGEVLLAPTKTGVVTTEELEAKEKEEERKKEEAVATQAQEETQQIESLTRQQQIQNLQAELGITTGKPALPQYATTFEALRSEYGIAAIESRMNDLNKLIRDTEASLRQGLYDVEGKLKPMELIGTEQRELQRQGQETLDTYNREKQTLVDEYNTKANLINSIMKMKEMDYNAASNEYNTQFNQMIQLSNILEGRETREQQEENRLADDARANLNIILGLAKGQTWDTLDDSLKSQIKTLEMKAGLPGGIIANILANIEPTKKMKTTIVSKDNTKVSILYDDGSVDVYNTGLTPEAEDEQKEIDKFYAEADKLGGMLDDGTIEWDDAWNRLHTRYPNASVELIDQTLTFKRREAAGK